MLQKNDIITNETSNNIKKYEEKTNRKPVLAMPLTGLRSAAKHHWLGWISSH